MGRRGSFGYCYIGGLRKELVLVRLQPIGIAGKWQAPVSDFIHCVRLADLKQHPSFEVGGNNWMSKLKPLGILREEATAITTMRPSARLRNHHALSRNIKLI